MGKKQNLKSLKLTRDIIKQCAVFALVYLLLFNSVIFLHKFGYYKSTPIAGILDLLKDAIYIYISLNIIFISLSFQRFLFAVGSILLFITGAITSYYKFFFKISPSKEMIGSFFSTDYNEVLEIVSLKLIVWLIFSLLVCLCLLKRYYNIDRSPFVAKILAAICLFFTIFNIITPKYKILAEYFPIQYLHNSYLFFKPYSKFSVREDISKKFTFLDKSDTDIIAVLIIGESARFDHFGINGYERNTTPKLAIVSNLLSFKAQSSSNHTCISVPSMLSRHPTSALDKTLSEMSILSIFTKLGYNTNWIGTQSLIKYFRNNSDSTIYNEINFYMIPGGSLVFKMNDHDGKMIPYIEDNISNSSGKNLLVIHMSGSHWNYTARYPIEFQKFTPVCDVAAKNDPSTCSIERLVNSYDNSILYTDSFIHNVIALLKNKNAFLLYVSDHGESLGEEGRYSHGGDLVKEQTTIPFIVWVSDKFKAKHSKLVDAIKSHSEVEISHDYVFHTMLDCLNINSEIVNKSLSLCHND